MAKTRRTKKKSERRGGQRKKSIIQNPCWWVRILKSRKCVYIRTEVYGGSRNLSADSEHFRIFSRNGLCGEREGIKNQKPTLGIPKTALKGYSLSRKYEQSKQILEMTGCGGNSRGPFRYDPIYSSVFQKRPLPSYHRCTSISEFLEEIFIEKYPGISLAELPLLFSLECPCAFIQDAVFYYRRINFSEVLRRIKARIHFAVLLSYGPRGFWMRFVSGTICDVFSEVCIMHLVLHLEDKLGWSFVIRTACRVFF